MDKMVKFINTIIGAGQQTLLVLDAISKIIDAVSSALDTLLEKLKIEEKS